LSREIEGRRASGEAVVTKVDLLGYLVKEAGGPLVLLLEACFGFGLGLVSFGRVWSIIIHY